MEGVSIIISWTALLGAVAALAMAIIGMFAVTADKHPRIARLLCKIGVHGPEWYGVDYGRTGIPFVRVCPHCGQKWYGRVVEIRNIRTIGGFRTEKQLRAGK